MSLFGCRPATVLRQASKLAPERQCSVSMALNSGGSSGRTGAPPGAAKAGSVVAADAAAAAAAAAAGVECDLQYIGAGGS